MKHITCKFCKNTRFVYTGKELKRIRCNNNLTLRRLGEILHVSASFLNDCEHDRRNLSDIHMGIIGGIEANRP